MREPASGLLNGYAAVVATGWLAMVREKVPVVLDQVDGVAWVGGHHAPHVFGEPVRVGADLSWADLKACPVVLPERQVEQPDQVVHGHRLGGKVKTVQLADVPGEHRQGLPDHRRCHCDELVPWHGGRRAVTAHGVPLQCCARGVRCPRGTVPGSAIWLMR